MSRTEKHTAPDAIVIGGGVIGLSSAWKIATSGLAVTVVDPEPGHGASWAAAGMLAPVGEVHFGEEDLLALNLASAEMWPMFASELEAFCGRTIDYRRCGTLVVAANESDKTIVEQLFDFQRELGLRVEWLTGRQARDAEPNLSPGVRAGLLAVDDRQVDNRLLVGALLEAASSAGCEIRRARVESVELAGGVVEGVRLEDGEEIRASSVVLAAGAWSAGIDGIPEVELPPVRPVKGQILRLRVPAVAQILERPVRGIVNGAAVYVVPRADGTVVVGSTVEEKGFDSTVTTGAVYELLRDAHRVVPAVAECDFQESMAGLRPGSPDNAPIVGTPAPGAADGLVVATGHFRNGVLLTPITAEAVAAMVCGGDPPAQILPFSGARFQVPSWSQ